MNIPPNRQLNKCTCTNCFMRAVIEQTNKVALMRKEDTSDRKLWGYPIHHGKLEVIDQCPKDPFIEFGTFEQLGKPQIVLRQIKNRKPENDW